MNEEEIRKQAERSVVEIHEFTPDMEPLGWKDKDLAKLGRKGTPKDKAKHKPNKNRPIKSFKGIKVPSSGWHAKTAFLLQSSGSFAGREHCICSSKGAVIAFFSTEHEAQKWWSSYCRRREYEVTLLQRVKPPSKKRRKVEDPKVEKPEAPISIITSDPSKDHTKNSNHCVRPGCQRFRVRPHDFCDVHL